MSHDDITRNYHGGNKQSEEANRRTRKHKDRARVVMHIWSCGTYGCTCYEAEQALGMRHQTCSARFSDLKNDGVIIGTGQTRPTDTGSPAEVYILFKQLERAATEKPAQSELPL